MCVCVCVCVCVCWYYSYNYFYNAGSYIKMGNNKKKSRKYQAGYKYCLLCMEEKLAVASYNRPWELFNQRSEILNSYRHKKDWLLGK